MPVNLFGLCANMPAIMELAKKFNLKVIEDACGFDSWIGEKHSGTFQIVVVSLSTLENLLRQARVVWSLQMMKELRIKYRN